MSIDRIMDSLRRETDAAILIHHRHGTRFELQWYGLTPEQVALALYSMADGIVDEKIPPPDLSGMLGNA